MGCEIDKGYDGRDLQVHRFDSKLNAHHYLTVQRGYDFERHETWGLSSGIDFYAGPNPGDRASLRESKATGGTYWTVYFWEIDPS